MNIKDIAKLAGVGVSTVSRVLNNYPDVKDSTREKVLKIVKESNYTPNSNARILKQNNTKNIGVLVKGMFNPFFSEMVNIISCNINKSGYTMILQQNYLEDIKDKEVLKIFVKEKRLQGVICLGGDFDDIEQEDINKIDVPIVLTSVNIYNKKYKDGFTTITIDDKKAAYVATELLISKGHQNIGVIAAGDYENINSSEGSINERIKGVKEALLAHGIRFNENNILNGKYSSQKSYDETKRLLENNSSITAIFALSDIMAIGSAKAVVDLGRVIGKDISIVGFDGMEISEFYNPPISTIIQPKEEMAKLSWQILSDLINEENRHKHLIFDTELIIRKSCSNVNKEIITNI